VPCAPSTNRAGRTSPRLWPVFFLRHGLRFRLVVQLRGGDRIRALQPPPKIDFPAAPRTERPKPRCLRFFAKQAVADRADARLLHTVPTPESAEGFDIEAFAALIPVSFEPEAHDAPSAKGSADFVLVRFQPAHHDRGGSQ